MSDTLQEFQKLVEPHYDLRNIVDCQSMLREKLAEIEAWRNRNIKAQARIKELQEHMRTSCDGCMHEPADNMKHPCDECCYRCRCNYEIQESK